MPPSYGVGSALALILTVILLIITIGYVRVSVQLVDLPPFEAAIKAGTLAIMPSHLRVPELTGDLPATVSGAALTGLLRGELGFTGVIVSDALEMRAMRDMFGIPGPRCWLWRPVSTCCAWAGTAARTTTSRSATRW